MPIDGRVSGVIGCQGHRKAIPVPLQQKAQVLCASVDILSRIKRIPRTESLRCRRQQLHQSVGVLDGNGERVATASPMNDQQEQDRVDFPAYSDRLNQTLEIALPGQRNRSRVNRAGRRSKTIVQSGRNRFSTSSAFGLIA